MAEAPVPQPTRSCDCEKCGATCECDTCQCSDCTCRGCQH